MFTQPVRTESANRRPSPRSRVKIADSSPYGDALVCSIASSSEEIDTTGAIGPNVSSVATRESAGTASSTVGAQYRSVGNPSAREPPATTAAPRSTASATCSSILSATPALLTGPIVVASSNGSPSRTVSVTVRASRSTNSSRTASCTRIRSPAVQLWPAHRKQAATTASTAALDIRVVHDHDRAVAAHLDDHGLAGRRGRRPSAPSGSSR